MHISERGFAGHDQYTTIRAVENSQTVLNRPKSRATMLIAATISGDTG
jgi:hypothetical protein